MSGTAYTMGTDVLDIEINQNAPFVLRFEYANDAGTGLFAAGDTLQFKIRSEKRDDATILADFGSYFSVIDATNASVAAPATYTATLDFNTGYYTIQLVRGGAVIDRLAQGVATLNRNT